MGHSVSLLAGSLGALRPYLQIVRGSCAYALTPGAQLLVLPLTEQVHDALHAAYGTGEWLPAGPRLSSRDLAFALDASRGTALAYLETDYFGGVGGQCAVLWVGGGEVLRPACMDAAVGRTRPPVFWPINAALKGLGVAAPSGLDEFTAFGLGNFRSNERIIAEAVPVAYGSL